MPYPFWIKSPNCTQNAKQLLYVRLTAIYVEYAWYLICNLHDVLETVEAQVTRL